MRSYNNAFVGLAEGFAEGVLSERARSAPVSRNSVFLSASLGAGLAFSARVTCCLYLTVLPVPVVIAVGMNQLTANSAIIGGSAKAVKIVGELRRKPRKNPVQVSN